MNTYTKENAGFFTLETILGWVEEDNKQPTIADELKKGVDWEAKREEEIENEVNDLIYNK